MKIALTGGIACGKSLLVRYLNELGVETLDADDIVHELIPADERKRLAAVVFNDPEARKALEARIHPLVKDRILTFLGDRPPCCGDRPPRFGDRPLRVAVIPLLFEVHWENNFDIIISVISDRETQIARMMTTRGYTREEALARLSAQLPVAEKAARSRYVIENNGTQTELKAKAGELVSWLKTFQRQNDPHV